MVEERIILAIERLRDDISALRSEIRKRYGKGGQVTAPQLRKSAAQLAEIWLVQVAPSNTLAVLDDQSYVAELGVLFQRVLTYSEHATTRSKYDETLNAILAEITNRVVVPLKQARSRAQAPSEPTPVGKPKRRAGPMRVFVGHSFSDNDKEIVEQVVDCLTTLGMEVITGEKPQADRISDKVKDQIEGCDLFVGLFTRRDKISGKKAWTTSTWVIDEKAYALGRQKKLLLIKENGVDSIGGLQGDYEYIEFERTKMGRCILKLLKMTMPLLT